MKSTNLKRSIVLKGHKTSVSLETEFWEALREIASAQKAKLSTLVWQIDEGRQGNNLSSAIRVFVLNHLRAQIAGIQTNLRILPELPIEQRRLYA
jgi:predicted DNA-binding ribbon-helix-helix protein